MTAQKRHFSLRLRDDVLLRIEEQAAARGVSKTALAETYLAEAATTADHTGIVSRAGPAGRRAGLVGGPDVWEVVETYVDEERDIGATARYLAVSSGLVQAALGYYADNRDGIDRWIARNAAVAESAEAAWRRQTNLG